MKAFYVMLQDGPEPLDMDLLETYLYTVKRSNESYGASGSDVDVMIAPSALPRVWKGIKAYYGKKFGLLLHVPDAPEIKLIREIHFNFATFNIPHAQVAMHLILNPQFDVCWPNAVAVIDWLIA